MLTYLNSGFRKYGEKPIRIYGRPYWEFQTVHQGAIAPTFPLGVPVNHVSEGRNSLLSEETLWVFPPGFKHGWTGRKDEEAYITVFHFDTLAEPAASFIRKEGYLHSRLTPQHIMTIQKLSAALDRVRRDKDPLSLLKFESAAIELSILALEALRPTLIMPLLNREELVASGAEAWYSEHMAEQPSIVDVAKIVNCSESHFRRLYVQARGISPGEAFENLRLSRARELLSRSGESIKEIASLCGYGSQSCFSRAFKRATGKAPRDFTV